jgi:hypothetical protein
MSAFRTVRPLLVDAIRCEQPTTISTRTGMVHASPGDWIVTGETGETYVVDNTFFQRTFLSFQTYPWEQQTIEGRTTVPKAMRDPTAPLRVWAPRRPARVR